MTDPQQDLTVDTCSFCGQATTGVRCLGGQWLCWECDSQIERATGRRAGRVIRDGLRQVTNDARQGRKLKH